MNRDDLRKAQPRIETATIRFVRGEITRAEYERQVAKERELERQPPGEQTAQTR
jgi:hypothetical protein